MKTFLILLITIIATTYVFAQAGKMDHNFGTMGVVETDFGSYGNDRAAGVLMQGDDKILVAGYTRNKEDYDFAFVRYNLDGTLDPDFGSGGIASNVDVGRNDYLYCVAMQDDGKIVSAGTSAASGWHFVLARNNPDGSRDTSFGGDGIVFTDLGNYEAYIHSIAVLDDHSIIATGYTNNDSTYFDIVLAKYEADGDLDSTFGENGIVFQNVDSISADYAYAVAVQPDGKIIVGGNTVNDIGGDFLLLRYHPDGTPDTSFGVNGMTIIDLGTSDEKCYALALQNDGKIIAAGSQGVDYELRHALGRFLSDGEVDTSFGDHGFVSYDGPSLFDEAYSVAIQDDGKILIGGTYGVYDYDADVFVNRYNADGSADLTFSYDGTAGHGSSTATEQIRSIALQPDGKILAAGSTHNGFESDFLTLRFHNDNTDAIEENIEHDAQIIISPNPFTDEFAITCTSNISNTTAEISLFDMTGKLIYYQNISSSNPVVSAAFLTPGIYLLNYRADNFNESRMVVKEK